MPLASIYPLVSTRALARPFTYEVGDAVARGDILSIRLGARAVRGVVVDVGVDPPPGVEVVSAGPAVGSAAPERTRCDRPRTRDRPDAAGARPLPRSLRRARRRSPLRADRRRAS